ncbi:MAG: primase protein [candidate division TM6 bacterium GW2011_GWF2_43_17]|nr:MAG: primase protein [candidate division TM6 bacterium GW2011_GWF2_43_17]HAU30652.1 DNA primase [Candidatus Dependentiae bacterium]
MSSSLFDFVKSQVPILDVVREYVALKPAGNYWKGPSPFKQERVPSFTVTPTRGIYYCFSTATGGDVIDFVARVENCSPLEAAWHLVERYNIKVPEGVGTREDGARSYAEGQRHEVVCAFFAQWCGQQLRNSPDALMYVASRGLGDIVRQAFGIGFCPGGNAAVRRCIEDARSAGILAHELEASHLIKKGAHGTYLTFDDRIIFTIFTAHGRPCGFGGRVFRSGDDRAKYVNSQEHEFFNKRTLLYGFWQAKKVIQEAEAVYLVEGYTDCLAMVQHGYVNTVATLGTACSLEHVTQLARHARHIYLLYDGDEAGQRAMMRLVSLCWQVQLEPFVVSFPADDDPATFLAREGSLDALQEAPKPLFTFFVERLGRSFVNQSLARKLQAAREVFDAVALVPDRLQQNVLLQQAAEIFGVPVESLYQEFKTFERQLRSREARNPVSVQEVPGLALTVLEKRILFAIMKNGPLVFSQEESLLPLILSPHALLLVQKLSAVGGSVDTVMRELEGSLRQTFLEVVTEGEVVGSVLVSALRDEIFRRAWNIQLHDSKRELCKAQAAGDQERMVQALRRLQEAKDRMLSRGNG